MGCTVVWKVIKGIKSILKSAKEVLLHLYHDLTQESSDKSLQSKLVDLPLLLKLPMLLHQHYHSYTPKTWDPPSLQNMDLPNTF